MEQGESGASSPPASRGRGRGRSRGGLGKYLRARGRGRSYGRPAEFSKRLVLEGEEKIELESDSEEAKELRRKYASRKIASNADRYAEPEPVLNSDGICTPVMRVIVYGLKRCDFSWKAKWKWSPKWT